MFTFSTIYFLRKEGKSDIIFQFNGKESQRFKCDAQFEIVTGVS